MYYNKPSHETEGGTNNPLQELRYTAQDFNEYKKEMVTLHILLRNEETEILEEIKFIGMYERNKNLILKRRKEFETDLDMQKTMEIVRQLCREEENKNDDSNLPDIGARNLERDDLQELYQSEFRSKQRSQICNTEQVGCYCQKEGESNGQ